MIPLVEYLFNVFTVLFIVVAILLLVSCILILVFKEEGDGKGWFMLDGSKYKRVNGRFVKE